MNTTNNPKENKFNFSEEDKQKETVDQKKEAVKKDAEGLFKSIKTFLQELLDFREDTDRDATIEATNTENIKIQALWPLKEISFFTPSIVASRSVSLLISSNSLKNRFIPFQAESFTWSNSFSSITEFSSLVVSSIVSIKNIYY